MADDEPLLEVERAFGREGVYTGPEVAERAGLDDEFLRTIRRAQGLPVVENDERAYDERDVEAARTLKLLRDAGLSDEGVLDVTRAFSRAMTQVVGAVRTFVTDELVEPDAPADEVSERLSQAARGLGPQVGPMLGYLFEEHLREQIRSDMIGQAGPSSATARQTKDVCVCFADLVGFTKLGESVEAERLGGIASQLEKLAAEVAQPPVKLVKTIGDAVMLVSPETAPLLDAVLELARRAEDDNSGIPLLRVGIARGQALNRWGDWYGSPVNLASRVTGVARPGSVLVTEDVKEAAEDGYRWSFAGARRLKGVHGAVPLHRVRPAEGAEEGVGGRR